MGKVRRIARAMLWSLAAIIGLLALLIGGMAAYASIDKEDTFVLRNAEFHDANYLRQSGFSKPDWQYSRRELVPVYAHRLKHGSGIILAYRFYSNGDFGTIDDEDYRKATVWIAGALPSSTIEVPLGDESKCVFVLSRGGSAWPMSECSRYGTSGTVKVEPIGKHFKITIRGEVRPVENAQMHYQCETERVDLTFKAKEIAFQNLTPWLGIAGRHPYDETYR